MIEVWLPVILGVVIVGGMVTARVWTTLLSEGLPILRDWVVDEYLGLGRGEGPKGTLPSRAELGRRVEELEDRLRFVESRLPPGRGPSSSASSAEERPAAGSRAVMPRGE